MYGYWSLLSVGIRVFGCVITEVYVSNLVFYAQSTIAVISERAQTCVVCKYVSSVSVRICIIIWLCCHIHALV